MHELCSLHRDIPSGLNGFKHPLSIVPELAVFRIQRARTDFVDGGVTAHRNRAQSRRRNNTRARLGLGNFIIALLAFLRGGFSGRKRSRIKRGNVRTLFFGRFSVRSFCGKRRIGRGGNGSRRTQFRRQKFSRQSDLGDGAGIFKLAVICRNAFPRLGVGIFLCGALIGCGEMRFIFRRCRRRLRIYGNELRLAAKFLRQKFFRNFLQKLLRQNFNGFGRHNRMRQKRKRFRRSFVYRAVNRQCQHGCRRQAFPRKRTVNGR